MSGKFDVVVDARGVAWLKVANDAKCAMLVRASFGVHDEALATGFYITLGHHVWREHHEVSFKRNFGERTSAGNDVGTKCEVGNKLTIHHVPLNEVDTGFIEGNNCFAQL